MEKTKGFHITIVDLDNDKILVDENSNCIVGGFTHGDVAQGIGYYKCNSSDLFVTIDVAQTAVNNQKKSLLNHCFGTILKKKFEDDDEHE